MTQLAQRILNRIAKLTLEDFCRMPVRDQRKVCDDYWSVLVKLRDGFKCRLKGKDRVKCSNVHQAAHLITRGARSIRHDLRNGVDLCSGHHSYYTYNSEEWVEICKQHFRENYEAMSQAKWTRKSKTSLVLTFVYLRTEHGKILSQG